METAKKSKEKKGKGEILNSWRGDEEKKREKRITIKRRDARSERRIRGGDVEQKQVDVRGRKGKIKKNGRE